MIPPNAHRLAAGLQRLEGVGDCEVRAHVVFGLLDRFRSIFIDPDPVFEIESGDALKFLMRDDERPLTVRELTDRLLALSDEAAAAPMIATVVLAGSEGERFTVNIPTQSASVRVDRRKRRVILTWFAVRRN